MGSKVTMPVRILALVGLLGALALATGFTLLGRSSGSKAAPHAIKPLHPVHKHTAPAAKPVATVRPTHAAARKSAAKHAARPVAKTKPKRAATPVVRLPANGLPAAVNEALARHEVVVVSLYDPEADVDAASVGEAEAGAQLAKVGFVPLSVLSQAQAEPLAKKLGVLSDPALLVFRRPGELVFRVNGFADRATVAQAAVNALP